METFSDQTDQRFLADPAIRIWLPLPQSETSYQGAPLSVSGQGRVRSSVSLQEQIARLFRVGILVNVCIFTRIWNKTCSYCNTPAGTEIMEEKMRSFYLPLTARGYQYLPKVPNNCSTAKLAWVHSTQSDEKEILKVLGKSLTFQKHRQHFKKIFCNNFLWR